jgi:hypothetical protein
MRVLLAASFLFFAAARGAYADGSAGKTPTPTWLNVAVLPVSYVNNQFTKSVSAIPEPLLNIEITARVYRHPVLFDQELWELCYPTPGGLVNNIGLGQHYVPKQNILEYSIAESVGMGLGPNWFIEAAQLYRTSSQFPDTIGFFIAGEKIPDFRRRFSLYGKLMYSPKFVDEDHVYDTHGQPLPINYQAVLFSGGGQSRIGRSNSYVNYGLQAEYFAKTVNAPANSTKITPFVGYVLRVI